MFSFGAVLNNRQSFLFLLELEIKKARQHRNYLSLLSLTFGHLDPSPGENPSISFKTLAHLVKDELRDTDIVGHGGGNCLLVMLPYADKEAAHKVRERLERCFQEYGFGGNGFTIEMGEVCFPTHATNLDDLLQMARNNVDEYEHPL